MAIISIQNLTKRFGQITAVDNLSLDIQEGTICGILGPNGAGKSTTIRILSTLTKPTSGDAFIGSYNVMTESVKAKKLIGVVQQNLNIDPELTPFEHLVVHGMLYGMNKRAVTANADRLLDFVELQDKRNIPAGKFSGGMKRRLTIARALVHDPSVIIMDEPTVGLDAHARRKLWTLMKELRSDGRTILLTTHYIEEAQALSDRIVILDRGKIIADDTPDNLINSAGSVAVDAVVNSEYRTFLFSNKSEASAFLIEKKTQGTLRESNLEDVFIKLTGRKVE